jgi:hypothetical protein
MSVKFRDTAFQINVSVEFKGTPLQTNMSIEFKKQLFFQII